jgi:hypothetical protein
MSLGAGAVVLSGCAPDLLAPNQPPIPTGPPTMTPFQPSLPTAIPTATHLPAATATHAAQALPTATPTLWTWSLATPTMTADPRALCFVLWDHQLARYGFRPRSTRAPLPETCPLRSGATLSLTPAWEAYWRGILHVCNPNMTKAAFEASWKGLVADSRAFTNNSDPESGNFALHSLTCGGATHQMVSGVPEGQYMRIYTLNHSKGPPPIPSYPDEIDITRHFFATTGSNLRLSDGSYAVFGFPQFENCIVPLLSPDDTDLIEVSRIKVVTNIQRPYNTEPVLPAITPTRGSRED